MAETVFVRSYVHVFFNSSMQGQHLVQGSRIVKVVNSEVRVVFERCPPHNFIVFLLFLEFFHEPLHLFELVLRSPLFVFVSDFTFCSIFIELNFVFLHFFDSKALGETTVIMKHAQLLAPLTNFELP